VARTVATNFTSTLQFPIANAATDLFKKEDVQTLALAVDGHDHSTGKGLILAATAIPANSITSAMIVNGTIVGGDIATNTIAGSNIAAATIVGSNLVDATIGTQQLAPNSVTGAKLAVGAISQSAIASGATANPTTTSASMVDCPDMAITLTFTGGDVLVWFALTAQNNTAGTISATQIALDGVDSTVVMAGTVPAANGLFVIVNMLRVATVSGSHTFKGRWAALTGGTLTGNSTARLLQVLEIRR
jgi:trimeric autotransporter adhesin